jgi:nucleotide-binding universal stress UspA family protein
MMKAEAAKSTHLLLLADESPASKRMADYIAAIIGRHRNFHLHLLYLMPRLPVQLLETGGGDTPEQEEEVNTELHRQQEEWISRRKAAAQSTLDELVATMRKGGVSRRAVEIEFSDPNEAAILDRAIPGLAAERGCHTIVIGHESHSWFHEMTGGHLTEHLLRHTTATAIWVVQ